MKGVQLTSWVAPTKDGWILMIATRRGMEYREQSHGVIMDDFEALRVMQAKRGE